MNFKKFPISEETARRAKEAISFRDYIPNSATNKYNGYIEEFENAVNALICANAKAEYPATPEQMATVQTLGDKYSEKLAEAINRDNEITARVPSIMITGGSKFPVRKKEKQNEAHTKFWSECKDLFDPTGNEYYTKIENILSDNVIQSNDPLAIEKLTSKLHKLEEAQTHMKSENEYYRKHKTMKGYEFPDGSEISEEDAKGMDQAIEKSFYKQPYAPYRLTNNNANIKRVKERIAELKKLKENTETPVEDRYPRVDGVEVIENAEMMRVQLIFDGKPEESVRSLLKRWGFRWAPSCNAWQRQLTGNGKHAARRVLEALAEQ